jgi:hypothetical protein
MKIAEQKKRFFVLVDNYARSHLGCFVAELDYSPEELVYTLCSDERMEHETLLIVTIANTCGLPQRKSELWWK